MGLVAGLLALLASADGGLSSPPADLACLAQHYAVLPVFEENVRHGQLPDGTRLLWEDGKHKTFEQRLATPDLQDIFEIPSNFAMEIDAVIPSIDTSANPLLAQTTPDMQFNRKGHIVVESEKTSRTTKKSVFAGGDIVTGAATVIKAVGAGRDAGMAIDKYLADGEWWDPNAPKPAEAAPAK